MTNHQIHFSLNHAWNIMYLCNGILELYGFNNSDGHIPILDMALFATTYGFLLL